MRELVQRIHFELLLVCRDGIVILLLRLVRKAKIVVSKFVERINLDLFAKSADGIVVLHQRLVGDRGGVRLDGLQGRAPHVPQLARQRRAHVLPDLRERVQRAVAERGHLQALAQHLAGQAVADRADPGLEV